MVKKSHSPEQVINKLREVEILLNQGGGLPPKKESSYNVRLELKIEGVNHGQEVAFSGAGNQ